MWMVSGAGAGRGDIAGWGLGDREGRGRDLADSERRRRGKWGNVVAERGPWCLCPELGARAGGLRPGGSAHPWLGGGDRPGLLSPGWHHRAVTFFFARRKSSPALALGPRGAEATAGLVCPRPISYWNSDVGAGSKGTTDL